MRPRRLEVVGFTAFRETTVVDFTDTDLFALVGPTGSGKSSIIDAMIFALYGSVPRYQNANLVAPAVSQGLTEARVRFDFSVDGREYSAVRVVRRTSANRATTKEARLDCNGEILAGNERELSEQVERIIGLSLEQFTTCVVLPQGEFARFLNEKPASRQDLLVKLLGLGMYDLIRGQASSRAAEATNRIALHKEELLSLALVTREAEKDAKERLGAIESASKAFRKDAKRIEGLKAGADAATKFAERLGKDIARLEKLAIPKQVEAFAKERARVEGVHAKCVEGEQQANANVEKQEKARTRLGDQRAMLEIRQDRTRLDSSRKDFSRQQGLLKQRRVTLDRAAEEEVAAQTALKEASDLKAAADLGNHAHAVRKNLKIGEPCPVCDQEVRRIPRGGTVKGDRAEVAVARAQEALERAQETRDAAKTAFDQSKGTVDQLENDLARLEKKLKSLPSSEEVDRKIAAIDQADEQLKAFRDTARKAATAAKVARQDVATLGAKEKTAWTQFDGERDALARLEPPHRAHDDLARSWRTLLEWGKAQISSLKAARAEQAHQADMQTAEKEKLVETHEAALTELGFEVSRDSLSEQIAAFVAGSRAALEQISQQLRRKAQLEASIGRTDQIARTASTLARHLESARFERWLLEGAFEQLVIGASKVLQLLSSGSYSFEYNNRLEFEVVDHANANEIRSARTLSGGETFLASLALALTLADQVADLATQGAAKLESIFLDEGFGSLDPATLDTVAGAIEELGSQGRMIGIVTHVPELADRVPVQYRVSKGSRTSSVERVAV